MSKEMGVILLGILNIVIATDLLAVPIWWRMLLLVLAGVTLIVIGFLLRAKEMTREEKSSPYHPFVENGSTKAVLDLTHDSHKEGITSLN